MLRSALIAKLSQEKKNTTDSVKRKSTKKIQETTEVKTKSIKHESVSFDEEILELGSKFRVDPNCVKKGIEGLIKLTSENPKLKNNLFDDDQLPLYLQVNSIRVAKGHPRIVRIPLKHSVLTPDSEVCLIVPDVKGIPNKKHEEHLEHYEKLLRQKGVDKIKKIMTFHEFRTEYETFELKSRLVELYDAFLVDGRISGKTVAKCGKIFYQKRKVPSAIKMRASKLKEHIQQTLCKTPLYLHSNGDSFMIPIGHSKMKIDEVVENVFYVIKGLEVEFPGGFGNIRNLNLRSHRGISVPIYSSLKRSNDVDLSQNVKKVKIQEAVSGELTTRLNSGVKVEPTGEVTVYKLKKRKRRNSDSNIRSFQSKKGRKSPKF